MINKQNLPSAQLDDWDLLQAAFEAMILSIGTRPGFDPLAVINREFPPRQSQSAQHTRLKQMLSQRNLWDASRPEHQEVTPTPVLEKALASIQNDQHLLGTRSVKDLLTPYAETVTPIGTGLVKPQYPFFYRDFWEFLATKKMNQECLLTPPKASPPLTPGEKRTLAALKNAFPNGLTIKELSLLTRKDELAELTPEGSLGAWLNSLKEKQLVRSEATRPLTWFFVKEDQS